MPTVSKTINFSEISNELHKQVIEKFNRRRVIVFDIDEIWAVDIVQMPIEWKSYNNSKTLILSVIDCFSKYAWLVVLDNKQSQTIINALISIFKTSKRKPKKLWTDNGGEFISKEFKKQILDKYKIELYHTYANFHSSIVERFNRTLKNWTFKALDENNSKNWVKLIPQLIDKYNNKKHSTIRMTPIDASKPANSEKVFNNLYGKFYDELMMSEESEKPRFKVNDIVRITRDKTIFEKQGDQTFTNETFQIREILNTIPITYKLSELEIPKNHMRQANQIYKSTPMDGSFYTQELQITKEPDYYRIEKVIERKKIKMQDLVNPARKRIQLVNHSLCKFVGWDNKYNLWIPDSELTDL